MMLTIETAANGYIVRVEDGDPILVSDADEVAAAMLMLNEVNYRIGHTGSGWDAELIRVIVMPGRKWLPLKRDDCKHVWVERVELANEPPRWRCPVAPSSR